LNEVKRTLLLQISLSPFPIKLTPLLQTFLTPLSNNLPPFLPISPTKIPVKLSVNSVNPILLIEISPLSPKPKLKMPLLNPLTPLPLVLITLICFTLNTLVLMPLLTSLPCSTFPFLIAPLLQSGKLPRLSPSLNLAKILPSPNPTDLYPSCVQLLRSLKDSYSLTLKNPYPPILPNMALRNFIPLPPPC